MKTFIISFVFLFLPFFALASLAEDFQVNDQQKYAVPRSTTRVLVLDLTLPEPSQGSKEQLQSIKFNNAGTALSQDISRISIYEDGPSPGWDGDESVIVSRSSAPFWGRELSGSFSEYGAQDPQRRIFVTVDISATAVSGRTIQLELSAGEGTEASAKFVSETTNGPTGQSVLGLEREIDAQAPHPTVPLPPLIDKGEAVSDTVIRWHFLDLANNEWGFKVLDGNLETVAKTEQANVSYVDETGLEPETEYSGRRIVAYNDRGEGGFSDIFSPVFTLSPPPPQDETPEEEEEEEESQEPEESEGSQEPEGQKPEAQEPEESEGSQEPEGQKPEAQEPEESEGSQEPEGQKPEEQESQEPEESEESEEELEDLKEQESEPEKEVNWILKAIKEKIAELQRQIGKLLDSLTRFFK